MYYGKNMKVCATCADWDGSRNLVNGRQSAEPTCATAKCLSATSNSRGCNRTGNNTCARWVKWSALK